MNDLMKTYGTLCTILMHDSAFSQALRWTYNNSGQADHFLLVIRGRNYMKLEDLFKRMLVVLMRVKPEVLDGEEKEKARQKMIEENRKQDRDLFTCEKELIEGLKIEEVPLSSCGAWMVQKEGNQNDKVVYYIHGGGFVNSCTKSRMRFVSYLVKNFHYNVFSIDYRLFPEVM